MAQSKRHYNNTLASNEIAARMFENAAIEYDSRDHAALASDLADVLADGESVNQFIRNIGGLKNLRGYVDTIRHNYFES